MQQRRVKAESRCACAMCVCQCMRAWGVWCCMVCGVRVLAWVCACVRCVPRSIVIGRASSMGAVLCAAGEPGQRLALPHSKFMIHEVSSAASRAKISDLRIRIRDSEARFGCVARATLGGFQPREGGACLFAPCSSLWFFVLS